MAMSVAETAHPVTLVLGGARSGKSRYAQELAAVQGRVLFVATATGGDAEMRAKIARHQADREVAGLAWTVCEEPVRVGKMIAGQGAGFDVAVVDCLTLYVGNLMERDDAGRQMNGLLNALQAAPCAVVLVSNEVGSGVVPEFASGREYRELLGELNQRVAALATDVVLMVAGLPLVLKGGGR